MFGAGTVYLLFERDVTSRSRSKKSATTPTYLSRMIMGMQVGIILLTVLVTRSSVTSIQSKQGPPTRQSSGRLVRLIASIIVPFLHRLAPNYHYLHRLGRQISHFLTLLRPPQYLI